MESKEIVCRIRRYMIQMDPPLSVFSVELHTPTGVWTESFGSEGELTLFLRGVQAGMDLAGGGHLSRPEIPSGGTSIRIPKPDKED